MPSVAYDADLGGTTIKQCTAAELSPNISVVASRASGGIAPAALYVNQGEPRARWSSADIATALSTVGANGGLCLSSSNLVLAFQGRTCTALASSGQTFTCANSLTTLQSLTANQGDAMASIDFESLLLSTDGFVVPVTLNASASISNASAGVEYRLGPAKAALNGGGSAQIPGVQGVTVNFGIGVLAEYQDGGTFPTAGYVTQTDPSIDLRFKDMASLASVGPLFQDMQSLTVYLRKKSDSGDVVAEATAEHIAITFATGISAVQSVAGSGIDHVVPAARFFGKALTTSSTSAISV